MSDQPDFRRRLGVFGRIGLLSFGGPAAQIALMHRYLVEETGWLKEPQFLNALSFCMLLPGPEAMQLATYAGWRLHGLRGGLAAGLLFVLPGALIVLALAWLYLAYGAVPLMQALFLGIKAAVLVIVAQALAKVAGLALKRPAHWVIAGLGFAGIFLLGLPFPLIVLFAGLYGFWSDDSPPHTGPVAAPVPFGQTMRTVALWLAIWLVPLLAVGLTFGVEHVLSQIALLFSKLAVVTFGGAYAVLTYLAEEVAVNRAWLTPQEMVDGLGLAETTPGPLILVTEFVAVIAASREAGMGLAGALVCLWATFAPCFLWVFAGAPYIERLDALPRLRSALAAITAAVVGVILNLALFFALHVLFDEVRLIETGPLRLWVPDLASFDPRVVVLTLAAAMLLWRGWNVPLVIVIMAALGWAVAGMP